MHKLLKRQLVRQFGSLDEVPAQIASFVSAVNDAYEGFDQDRVLYERSLDLTSAELLEKNRLLQQESEETRQILAGIPDGLAVARNGRYLFVNPQWAASLGYEPGELAGVAALDLVLPADHPVMVRRTQSAEQTGTNGVDEIRFRTKSGGTVLLELSPARRIRYEGDVAYLTGSRDVTNRKQDEQRTLHAARMASMGALTAGIAHELNNPLSFVISNLGFVAAQATKLDARDPVFEDMKSAIADAQEGAERVRVIVQDLKAFSRADSEGNGPVSLRRVVESATKLAMNEIRPKAKLMVALGADVEAEGNEAKLGQVILNLLVNAAQAIPDGSSADNEIRVGIRQEGERVCIEVSDTGSGMPAEIQAKIFEPFFTTKPVGVGTGLGLAICHGIVSAMNGQIELESEVGKGTTFRIWLSASTHEQRETSTQAVTTSSGARILVLDDEPLVGSSIRRALSGHLVTFVRTGAEALHMLRAGREFDLILCDLMMPEMNGMEFFEALLPREKDRTAFITGGAFTEETSRFLASVTNAKIAKPFTSQGLQSEVAQLLQRAHGCEPPCDHSGCRG